jgi:hypothetical protein
MNRLIRWLERRHNRKARAYAATHRSGAVSTGRYSGDSKVPATFHNPKETP